MASFEPELAQAMGIPFSTPPEDPAPPPARDDSDPRDQQVMTSPSAAAQEGARGTVTTATGPGLVVQQATERAMEPEGAGAGYGATDHEVAVRTLAVQELTTTTAVGLAQAMAGSPQGVRNPGDIAGGQATGDTSGPEPPWWAIGRETAAEARRLSVPAWMQRLGAFFQAVGNQQTAVPVDWMPSSFPSPPPPSSSTRRRLEPPMVEEAAGSGQQALFTREQMDRVRRMERQAPLLYGPPQQQPGEPSSGGSTYEAVQEEVRRQLKGVVDQLEASRREVEELRGELHRARSEQVAARELPDASGAIGGPKGTLGSILETPSPGREVLELGGIPVPSRDNDALRTPPRRQREPLQHPSGQPRTYGGYLNSQAPQLPQPSPQVPTVTSRPPGLTRDPPQEGQDMMQRLLEGLEKVISKERKGEALSRNHMEVVRLSDISETSAVDFGDWVHCLQHPMGDISAGSSDWWRELTRTAKTYYEGYVKADQYNRLTMSPTPSDELASPRWTRVDRRAQHDAPGCSG